MRGPYPLSPLSHEWRWMVKQMPMLNIRCLILIATLFQRPDLSFTMDRLENGKKHPRTLVFTLWSAVWKNGPFWLHVRLLIATRLAVFCWWVWGRRECCVAVTRFCTSRRMFFDVHLLLLRRVLLNGTTIAWWTSIRSDVRWLELNLIFSQF